MYEIVISLKPKLIRKTNRIDTFKNNNLCINNKD